MPAWWQPRSAESICCYNGCWCSMSYPGIVQNGVIVLDGGAVLPDGTPVRVEPVHGDSNPPADQAWQDELLKLAGTATGLPSDLARNHDHYLYGTPKK